MAKLNVNIGLSVNDKTGDTLRTAFDKINQNFTELYTLTGGTSTALTELAQDYAAPLFNHASHVNITAAYDDANNKILLTGVAAQVQSDWNSSSGVTQILNKPTIPTSFSSLVNGSHTLSLGSTGNTTFPTGLVLGAPRGPNTVNFTTAIDKSFQIETGTSTTSKLWSFGTDGTTTFPTNVSINYSGGNVQFPRIIADSGKAFSIQAQGNSGSTALAWTVNPDAASQYAAVSVSRAGGDNLAKVVLQAQSDSGDVATAKTWKFDQAGTLTFPDATIQSTAFTTSPTLNILKIDNGVHEKFQTKADATGIVTHDCSLGHIFYHTSPDALFTVNFTNLNLSSGYATALTLIIVQGGTGFIPNSVGIGGVIQTLNWQGNVTPTPSTNRTDVVTFSIINVSGTYTVLGQLTGF